MTESKEIYSIVIDELLLYERERTSDYASIRECLGESAPLDQCKRLLDRVVDSAGTNAYGETTSFFDWFYDSGYCEDVWDILYEAIDEYVLDVAGKIIDAERNVA